MVVFLFLATTLWFVLGFDALVNAKSVMHQILAAILFSADVMFLGIAGIVYQLAHPREVPTGPTNRPLTL